MPEAGWTSITGTGDQVQAISELVDERDRLRAKNAELMEALKGLVFATELSVANPRSMSAAPNLWMALLKADSVLTATLAKAREAG